MFIKRTSLFLAALGCLGLTAPVFAQPKAPFNPADVKADLRRAIDVEIGNLKLQFPDLKFQDPCITEYNAAVAAASAEAHACLNADNPPAGSPIAVFNAGSSFDQQKTCDKYTQGGLTCSAGLLKDQQKFCAVNAAKAKSRAQTARVACCSGLAAQKKKLEDQLKSVSSLLESCLGQ
jgi:hypothetical protein